MRSSMGDPRIDALYSRVVLRTDLWQVDTAV